MATENTSTTHDNVLPGRRPRQSASSSLQAAIGSRFLDGYLSRLQTGHITVHGPGARSAAYGDPRAALRATMVIEHPRFFRRAVVGGDVGFAESFIDGDWRCDDLASLIRIFAENRDALDDLSPATAWPRGLLNRAVHAARRNTISGNRRNIEDHYDLGNDFFRLFLDRSMTYSCGVFPRGDETLEKAQRLKLQAVLEKADIHRWSHVLEIGSGWGSFAILAARQTGCRVTTITLSAEQQAHVRQRVEAAGLSDRVEVKLQDYRHVEGLFDRIVSIEMLEAVGEENLGTFFRTCDRLLEPGGKAVVQVITIRDELYDGYRKGCDFIQRHIFPGGHLPCLQVLQEVVASASNLDIENVEDIGHHYTRTLREWHDAFVVDSERVMALGFDRRFFRKWIYYFNYCEAGFRSRMLGDLQLLLTKHATP